VSTPSIPRPHPVRATVEDLAMQRLEAAWLRALAFTALASLPGVAWAQSGIAGVVRDTSGAVLPGVTVEAASPALIEKVRSVTTGGDGAYRLIDLRFSKRHRIGKYRVMGNIDVFNIFNATGVVTLNDTYGPNWRRPLLRQGARFVKVSGQFDF
jgi:hypothetical protein